LLFLTSGHSDAQGWAPECPDIKITKSLNSHPLLYAHHFSLLGTKLHSFLGHPECKC